MVMKKERSLSKIRKNSTSNSAAQNINLRLRGNAACVHTIFNAENYGFTLKRKCRVLSEEQEGAIRLDMQQAAN